MNSNIKGFFDGMTAIGTYLGSISGVYLYKLSPGAFSLEFKYRKEHTPCGVMDRLGQMFILNHALDVKVFHYKTVVVFDEFFSLFMIRVKPLICYFLVDFGDKRSCFPASCGTFFSSGNPLLGFF